MARKVNRFNALHKKQSQIDAYMEKIREIEQQKKDLENEFALQVGQLILKKLKNDIDDVETFSEWLELYLLEQEEKANHWQNVNCTQKRLIWISKLVTIDFLLFLPSVLLWQLIGVVVNQTVYANYVGFVTWLLLIFLNHFHHLLQNLGAYS